MLHALLQKGCLMAIPVLMSLLALPVTSYSQIFHNSMWYQFDYDVKHYSTKVIPGSSNNRESVMAGTRFDDNGLGVPHFMRLDDGTVNSNTMFPGIMYDSLYPDPNFIDQRVKDIVIKAPNEYFMVVSARIDKQSVAPPYRDKIKIIKVDDMGNNQWPGPGGEKIIEDVTPPVGGNLHGYSLYPVSAMYRKVQQPVFPFETFDALYICGYVVTEDYLYPNYPNFQAPKMSFVLWVDIRYNDPSSWTVISSNYFESSPVFPTTTLNNPEVDFDIAMRMQNIEQGTYANTAIPEDDDIFVTGSVNAKTGTHNGPDQGQPYTMIRSATMVNVLDPWYLTRRITAPRHIVDLGNQDGFGFMEYGVGLVQANGGSDNYIVSNTYVDYPSGYGIELNTWHNTLGFNATPDRMAVTHTDGAFATSTGIGNPTREYLSSGSSGSFALQILPSNEPATGSQYSNNGSEVTFNLAGMSYYAPNPCHSAMTPYNTVNHANMVPFLFNVELEFSNAGMPNGDIYYHPYNSFGPFYGSYMTLFPNQTGTGDPTAFPNTYANLGQGLSYIAWNPKFADVEFAGSNELVMNAPKWDPSNRRLGLKTMFVDISGGGAHNMSSPCPVPVCDPGSDDFFVELVDDENATPSILASDHQGGDDNMSHVEAGDCMTLTTGSSVYKPASVTTVNNNTETVIYPNPATDIIMFVAGADVLASENITIQLVNIHGQQVHTLYKGSTEQMDKRMKLKLPYLSSGLYILQVTNNNGHRLYQERVTITQ